MCYVGFFFFIFFSFFSVSWFLLPHEIGTTVILADFELSNVTRDLDDARDYYTGEEGLHETWMCYLVFLIRLLYYSFEKRTMHDARVFFLLFDFFFFFFFTYDSLYFSFSVTFIVYMVYIFVCFPVFILFYFIFLIIFLLSRNLLSRLFIHIRMRGDAACTHDYGKIRMSKRVTIPELLFQGFQLLIFH